MKIHQFVYAFAALFLVIAVFSGGVTAQESGNTDTSTEVNISEDQPTSEGTIGYWDGVWYNDSFEFDTNKSAYLDASDREKMTKRAIARIEVLRNSTFDAQPNISIITRESYQRSSGGYTVNNGSQGEWNNVVWESMFMVDEETNVETELKELYGGQVKAFYSPSEDTLYIIVAQSQTDLVRFKPTSLVHELVHAYQDQKFDIGSERFARNYQDGELAKNSVIEGEAMYIETQYEEYCESGVWDCYSTTETSTTGSNQVHLGLQLTAYFPYSDGHAFVAHKVEQEGWDGVNESYQRIPAHTTSIIHYEKEVHPRKLSISKPDHVDWETYDYGLDGREQVGEATLAMMFWYQQREYGIDTGISTKDLTTTNDVSEYNYNYNITNGLEGDAVLPVYHSSENKTGYIFATKWNSSQDAQQFVQAYKNVLSGHSGSTHTTKLNGTVFTLPESSGYGGVYYITIVGDEVTVTHSTSLTAIKEINGIETQSKEVIDDERTFIEKQLEDIPLPNLIAALFGMTLLIGVFTKILIFDILRN